MIQPMKFVYDLNSWRLNANNIKDDEAAAAATATHLSGLNRTQEPKSIPDTIQTQPLFWWTAFAISYQPKLCQFE